MKTISSSPKHLTMLGNLAILVASFGSAHAGIFETHTFETFGGAASLPVPDGTPVGVSDIRTLESSIGRITGISVSLKTSGEYNGDLYAYLRHGGGGFAVLLNRSGVTASDSYGYADAGFDIVLDDAATQGDVHLYQNGQTPENGSPLTGTWAPDGRRVDPELSLDTTPRTAMLAEFLDLDGQGTWTLFLADLSGGGEIALESWGLTIEGEAGGAVPEPGAWACWAAVGLLGYAFWGRRAWARRP